jgi:hypothetical protein
MSRTKSVTSRGRAVAVAGLVTAVLAGLSAGAAAQTITATASGSQTPGQVPGNQDLQNGDFLIGKNLQAPTTGDGIDETTQWTFDFSGDPNYPIAGPLVSAKLTLTVRPGNGGVITDLVGIMDPTFTNFIGPGPFNTPIIQNLPVGVTSTVVIELLNHYSSADILIPLAANGGKLPMMHHDDVLMSFAKLELVSRGEDRLFECGSEVTHVQAVNRPGFTPTQVDFLASGGGLDPTPLLHTTVNVSGAGRSCLVVNFSTVARPLDRYVLFQVRVDGVPMQGHIVGFGGFGTPVVLDPEETDKNLPRMTAYTFFQPVEPGFHRIEVFQAGCCNVNPPAGPRAFSGSAVLAVHYR